MVIVKHPKTILAQHKFSDLQLTLKSLNLSDVNNTSPKVILYSDLIVYSGLKKASSDLYISCQKKFIIKDYCDFLTVFLSFLTVLA